MSQEIKFCPYCKCEIRANDYHATKIIADSSNDKKFLRITCILDRYYLVEPTEQK